MAEAPVWRTTVDEGEHLTVPISSGSPLDYEMEDGGFTSRKTAENYLRMVQFWTGIPRVVGVKQKTPGESSEGVLVVRIDRDGSAAWSDTKQRGETFPAEPDSHPMPLSETGR
mgnify:CR=1 FL=1